MPILNVRHVTTYRYKQPVSFGEHRILFRPRDSYDQRLIAASIEIAPEPSDLRWIHDVFGNCVAIARFGHRAQELRFVCTIRLDHSPVNALDFRIDEHARTYPFAYGADEMPDLVRCIERQYLDPDHELDRWARQFLRRDGRTDTHELLTDITHAIRQQFTYVARAEKGVQSPLQTLKLGSGSCRDFAVLMMEAARSLGFASRFVSGYLYGAERDRDRHVGGGSTHAWVQVYVTGAGWIEFDPTNGIVGNRGLIRVAVARDAQQAVPLYGTWTGFPSDNIGMSVEVDVSADAATAAAPAAPSSQAPRAGAAP